MLTEVSQSQVQNENEFWKMPFRRINKEKLQPVDTNFLCTSMIKGTELLQPGSFLMFQSGSLAYRFHNHKIDSYFVCITYSLDVECLAGYFTLHFYDVDSHSQV